jgi:imidazole glycerol-phosphate synthase subunit HisH
MAIWSKSITVIDIGTGNISSVGNALKHLGVPFRITNSPEEIDAAEKLIFPGVGNFAEVSKRMEHFGIHDAIRKRVLDDRIPILGICLGMQLFADYGDEGGGNRGLGLIKGKVRRLRSGEKALPLPHIGWNEVHFDNFRLFHSIEDGACFYFVHSYEMIIEEPMAVAVSDYGVPFVAAVQKDNIVGVQFHPEKSQKAGLNLLTNFCRDF